MARFLIGALIVTYPVVVWFGLQRGTPRTTALILLAVLVPIALARWRRGGRNAVLPVAVAIVGMTLAAMLDQQGYVLAVPVAISAMMFCVFAPTLRPGSVPMIERFARLQVDDLSDEQRAWCRLWTKIWCAFFVANGSIALLLALAGPLAWWTFYNGLLAYVLMGILFASEYLLRRRRFDV